MAGEYFVFEQDRFMREVPALFGRELKKAGNKVIKIMKKEMAGTDTKHEWINELSGLLKTKTETSADFIISQLTGLVDIPNDAWLLARADVVEYGMGYKRSGPRGADWPVRHIKGKAGINDSMTGFSPVSDMESFYLPDTWNHAGSHWFETASILADELFDEAVENALNKFDPMDYIVQA